MKYNLRWQLLLAFLALSLIISLLSFQVQTSGGLCTTRVPASGGTFTEGVVGRPSYLNPLLSDGRPVDEMLVTLIFDGLTRYGDDGLLEPALAQSWTVSEDGRSVRFRLREDVMWHDGQPVTSSDVAFTYGLMQDEAFPGAPALKTLWQAVTINVVDVQTIEFVLVEPYAPFLDATTRGILPQHLLGGTTAAALANVPFNRAPIGSGPFMVDGSENWEQSGRLRLQPSPAYWPQGSQLAAIAFQFYPDEATLLEAFANGDIQAINRVTSTALPMVAALPDVRLFTAVSDRYTSLIFNVSETAVAPMRDLEVRQALAYGLDRLGLVHKVLNGQGVPLEGPYLPNSWAYNPVQLTRYSYNPVTATTLLDGAGWFLPAGTTVRQQDDVPMTLRLVVLADPQLQSLAEQIGQQWQAVGVGVETTVAPDLTALRQLLLAREFDVALVTIAPPADPDWYDFWSQEAIIRGQNFAGWNNRRASEALESGRQVWDVAKRRPYYNTFLRLYDSELPALTLYQHVYTYALSESVNRVEIGVIDQPRERYNTFANWFILYRDVTIACPAETSEAAG